MRFALLRMQTEFPLGEEPSGDGAASSGSRLLSTAGLEVTALTDDVGSERRAKEF
jgi:hypothetical protein